MDFFLHRPKADKSKLWNLLDVDFIRYGNVNGKLNHLYDTVQSALFGDFDLDQNPEHFNHQGFEYVARMNEITTQHKSANKTKHIITDSEIKEGQRAPYGIHEKDALKDYSDAFESVLSNQTILVAIKAIDDMSSETLITTNGVDVLHSLMNALDGSIEAQKALKEAVNSDERVKEAVNDLLNSSNDGLLRAQSEDQGLQETLSANIANYLKNKK